MPTGARKVTGYSDISEQVLYERSIIRNVSNMNVMGTPGTTAVSVYVNALATVATYVPGTGVSKTNDGSAYVVLANLAEIAVNELLDGYTVETAPADLIASRFEGAVGGIAESVDTAALVLMEAGGTDYVKPTVVAAGSFVIGTWYIVKVANAALDASALVGTNASTAVVDEIFQATGIGTGLTNMTVQAVAPVAANAYTDILGAAKKLNDAKAPRQGRNLIVSTRVEQELLSTDSKLVLNTDRGDRLLMDGWIGRVAGFDVYVTTLLPSGTNYIAMQERGFAFKDAWKIEPRLQSLDGSGQFIGDSAIQGRYAYNCGVVRPTLIQLNQGVYTTA